MIGLRSVIANLHLSPSLYLMHLDHVIRMPANTKFLTMSMVAFHPQKHGVSRTERFTEIDAKKSALMHHNQDIPLLNPFLHRTIKRLWIRMTQILI